jgi:hypothetical protein
LVAPRSVERGLDSVACQFGVAQDRVGEGITAIDDASGEDGEGVAIASPCSLDQLVLHRYSFGSAGCPDLSPS